MKEFEKAWDEMSKKRSAPYDAAETLEIAYFTRRSPCEQGWIELGFYYHLDSDPPDLYRTQNWAIPCKKERIDAMLAEGSIAEVAGRPRVGKDVGLWLSQNSDVYLADVRNPRKGIQPPRLLQSDKFNLG